MKSLIVSIVLIVALNTTTAFASFFEVCELEAQVTSVSQLLATLNGDSRQVPGEVSTYHQLVTVKVSSARAENGRIGHASCNGHIDQSYELFAKASDGYEVGQVLKITLQRSNGRAPGGMARQERWTVNQ